jgi:hypothetical protein
MIDAPSLDDVPARDIHADSYDAVQEAERRLFGRDDSVSRYRDDAEKLFAKQPELPIDSLEIFPPMRAAAAEAAIEVPPEVPAAEPPRRILQSVTWVDPVEQRLREEEERKLARRKTRAPREARVPRAPSVRKSTGTRIRAQAAFDFTPPVPEPVQAPIQTANLDQAVRLPPVSRRARHPEPRILYNAWNYPRYLRDAREMPRDIAAIILKPGEGWKRRLPVAAWK